MVTWCWGLDSCLTKASSSASVHWPADLLRDDDVTDDVTGWSPQRGREGEEWGSSRWIPCGGREKGGLTLIVMIRLL